MKLDLDGLKHCSVRASVSVALKAFLHQKGEAAWKRLSYYSQKTGGTYVPVRDILE